MYLGIYLLFGAIVACEAKEPPSLACKKMDQAGTTCLDNAQVSTPTTAAGTGSGGMTQAQMMQLMTMFQQNQQQKLNSIDPTTKVKLAIDGTKSQLEAEKLKLTNENTRLRGENSSSNDAQKKHANNIKIEQNENTIRLINERLDSIAEATKDPTVLEQIGDRAVGECFNSFGSCMGKLGQGLSWLWSKTPWGGESEGDAIDRIMSGGGQK